MIEFLAFSQRVNAIWHIWWAEVSACFVLCRFLILKKKKKQNINCSPWLLEFTLNQLFWDSGHALWLAHLRISLAWTPLFVASCDDILFFCLGMPTASVPAQKTHNRAPRLSEVLPPLVQAYGTAPHCSILIHTCDDAERSWGWRVVLSSVLLLTHLSKAYVAEPSAYQETFWWEQRVISVSYFPFIPF